MKIARLVSLLGMFLSGCSVTALFPAAPVTKSPTATVFQIPTDTATITPTQPTATFTDTPTLIYANGTPTVSSTPLPTGTMLIFTTATLVIDTATVTSTVETPLADGIFTSIRVSGNQLFWGSCEPSSVLATVWVINPTQVNEVLIFLRLKGTTTGDTTAWGGQAIMNSDKKGTFTYSLTAQNFEHYREYTSAWGQYQFVALDAKMGRLGGSGLYLTNLTIAPCP